MSKWASGTRHLDKVRDDPAEHLPEVETPSGVRVERQVMYARISSLVVNWRCPDCGYDNKHRINYARWKVRCKNGDCHHVLSIGLAFWRFAPGGRSDTVPPDTLLGVRKRGCPVNLLVDRE